MECRSQCSIKVGMHPAQLWTLLTFCLFTACRWMNKYTFMCQNANQWRQSFPYHFLSGFCLIYLFSCKNLTKSLEDLILNYSSRPDFFITCYNLNYRSRQFYFILSWCIIIKLNIKYLQASSILTLFY